MIKKKIIIFDKKLLEYLSKLANIPLTDEEKELFTEQLKSVVTYFNILEKSDTSTIEPTYQSNTKHANIFQKETAEATTITVSDALSNAHESQEQFIITKKVLPK